MSASISSESETSASSAAFRALQFASSVVFTCTAVAVAPSMGVGLTAEVDGATGMNVFVPSDPLLTGPVAVWSLVYQSQRAVWVGAPLFMILGLLTFLLRPRDGGGARREIRLFDRLGGAIFCCGLLVLFCAWLVGFWFPAALHDWLGLTEVQLPSGA